MQEIPDWVAAFLNRRVTVEQELLDCASGVKPLPTAEQCREMALKLGVPDECRMGHNMGVSSVPKNNQKCRYASPRLLDRFVMWLGFDVDLHSWQDHKKIHGHTIYYCRTCECGANQVQNNGPRGDGKWRDVSAPWKWEWEKEQFEKAVPYSST